MKECMLARLFSVPLVLIRHGPWLCASSPGVANTFSSLSLDHQMTQGAFGRDPVSHTAFQFANKCMFYRLSVLAHREGVC